MAVETVMSIISDPEQAGVEQADFASLIPECVAVNDAGDAARAATAILLGAVLSPSLCGCNQNDCQGSHKILADDQARLHVVQACPPRHE